MAECVGDVACLDILEKNRSFLVLPANRHSRCWLCCTTWIGRWNETSINKMVGLIIIWILWTC